MDQLEFLRTKIPDFPGYSTEDGRRRSDELVRSYLGEALAEMSERLGPLPEPLEKTMEELLLRSGFTNQVGMKAFEDRVHTDPQVDGLVAGDAALVELAERAPAVPSEDLGAFLGEAAGALDRRDAIMRSAPAPAG